MGHDIEGIYKGFHYYGNLDQYDDGTRWVWKIINMQGQDLTATISGDVIDPYTKHYGTMRKLIERRISLFVDKYLSSIGLDYPKPMLSDEEKAMIADCIDNKKSMLIKTLSNYVDIKHTKQASEVLTKINKLDVIHLKLDEIYERI